MLDCIHLRILNVHHFGMVEGTELKLRRWGHPHWHDLLLSFIKLHQGRTDRLNGNIISLIFLFKESRLKWLPKWTCNFLFLLKQLYFDGWIKVKNQDVTVTMETPHRDPQVILYPATTTWLQRDSVAKTWSNENNQVIKMMWAYRRRTASRNSHNTSATGRLLWDFNF
jgi:hypothetical protein